MFLRIFVVSALFALALVVESQGHVSAQPATTLYPLVIAAYSFSALYALMVRRMPNLEAFTYLQFAGDALCIGLVILFTGAEESAFTLLFVFNILGAGYLLLVPGGVIVATLDVVVYVACLGLAWSGVAPQVDGGGALHPPPWAATPLEALSVYSTVAFHLASFYLLAFLSGSLARKQAETGRALARTANTLLRLRDMHGRIVQNIDVGLVTIDRSGLLTSFNRAAEFIMKHQASDVLGRPIGEVLRGIDRRISRVVDEAGMPIHGQTFERWATRKDGKRVFLRMSISGLRTASGEIEGYILVFEDRTRLLLMEEQLQREERLAAVGRLSAAIAHEIRNPLASITGSVQVLREGLELVPEDDELLGLVEREAARLNDLVSDFLSLARDESPDLQPGHLAPIVRETALLMERRGYTGLDFRVDLLADPELMLDSARMRQVFWNLFNNAAHAMGEEGTIEVRSERITPEQLGLIVSGNADSGYWEYNEVRAASGGERSIEPGGDALRLIVRDTGPGIPEESQARIFDPFYTTRSGGTGLGLAIVQRIVQSHGGVISVRSQLGEGTTFAIWLPIRDVVEGLRLSGPVDLAGEETLRSDA
jgi:two-component system, NtrC family, sensor histidine kinase PilS